MWSQWLIRQKRVVFKALKDIMDVINEHHLIQLMYSFSFLPRNVNKWFPVTRPYYGVRLSHPFRAFQILNHRILILEHIPKAATGTLVHCQHFQTGRSHSGPIKEIRDDAPGFGDLVLSPPSHQPNLAASCPTGLTPHLHFFVSECLVWLFLSSSLPPQQSWGQWTLTSARSNEESSFSLWGCDPSITYWRNFRSERENSPRSFF